MKRTGVLLLIMLLGAGWLFALPQQLEVIPANLAKEGGFKTDYFYMQGCTAYLLDNDTGIIRAWDINKKEFNGPMFARLPLKTEGDDITGDDNYLYVLDNKSSAIYLYNYQGEYIKTIVTKGCPDIQFKKANRILVNYQGIIFVLDPGRGEVLSFGNEGMFMGKTSILNPVSMCLGQDQLLRILVYTGTQNIVRVYDQSLKQVRGFEISTPQNKADTVVDLAVNQYNELYVIYGRSVKIGKVNSDGTLLSKTWGTRDKGDGPGRFMDPAIIKCIPAKDNAVIAILDKEQHLVKLHVESEFDTLTKLETPPITMRTFLEQIPEPICYDYLVVDSLTYSIIDTSVDANGKKKPTRALRCKNDKRTVFNLLSIGEAKRGVQSFDALARFQDKLFVVDSKACKVFIYNAFTGEYIRNFAQKGSKESRLNNPTSIAIAPDGTVYIADQGNMRIATFGVDTTFFENIDLSAEKLKPQLLRIQGSYLYFLANNNSIFEMPLSGAGTQHKKTLLANMNNISTFDLLYDERLGFVLGDNQRLVITDNNRTEHEYFARNDQAVFPHFAQIHNMWYNPSDRTLLISDLKAASMRRLNFWYSPKKPKTVSLILDQNMNAKLVWTQTEGINRWKVIEDSDAGTNTYTVLEPSFTIGKAHSGICRYTICSLTVDGKTGPPSEEVEDAYSYGRYLYQGDNFAQAILAFKRAGAVISDPRLDDEIVQTYIQEARALSSRREYEKSIKILNEAAATSGNKREIVLETTRVYKLMQEYIMALNYLERFQPEENAEMMREQIALNHLINNENRVLALTSMFTEKFGKDTSILLYQIRAYQSLERYTEALDETRELLTIENNLPNNLLVGELNIQCAKFNEAISQADRVLSTYTSGDIDVAHKIKGEAYYAMNQLGNAADAYTNAIRINPNKAEYYFMLGKVYLDSHNGVESQSNFARARELDPTNVTYGFAYALALKKANQISEALSVMDDINKYVTDESASSEYHELYYELLNAQQRYDDACKELELALEYNPDDDALASKLESAYQTRDQFNKDKPEIEVRSYAFFKLYPSLQKYYATHPIGSLTLYNNRNKPIQNINLKLHIPTITDIDWQLYIPNLAQNGSQQIDIIVPINRELLKETKNGSRSYPTELTISYSYEGTSYERKYDRNVLNSYNANSMDWSVRRQFASFVNPNDPYLLQFISTQIVQLFNNTSSPSMNKNIQRAMQIWSYYRANGISYVNDRTSSNQADSEDDYVKYPFQTLIQKSGDCEDLLALMAASLSVIGVDCGFIDVPGHVMLAIDTKMTFKECTDSGFDLAQFIFRNDKYWLPLETTLINKESFATGWSYALQNYNQLLAKEIYPEIIEFADAQALYPPVDFSEEIPIRPFSAGQQAIVFYLNDLDAIMKIGQITKEREYQRTLDKYPNNLFVANEYAQWCAQNGNTAKAKDLWEGILRQDTNYYPALVNLGNLYYQAKQYNDARIKYLQALNLSRDLEQVYRNLCLTEFYGGSISKAKEYFNLLKKPDLVQKMDYNAYSVLSRKGE